MSEMNFRNLTADDVECRVAMAKKTGVSLLLYKNARVDMQVLDETVGPMNWQRTHSRDNANCTVSIWDSEKGQWISKEDTGTESNTEKEKGLASDSFKRACFNWGIGRELYTAPFIWVPASECTVTENNGRFACYDRFDVQSMTVENKRITSLVITARGKVCYSYGAPAAELICEDCGKTIQPTPGKNGEMLTPEKINAISQKKYGLCLCCGCMKERAGK